MTSPVPPKASQWISAVLISVLFLVYFMPFSARADFGDNCTDAAAESGDENSPACNYKTSAEECKSGGDSVDQMACAAGSATASNLPPEFKGSWDDNAD